MISSPTFPAPPPPSLPLSTATPLALSCLPPPQQPVEKLQWNDQHPNDNKAFYHLPMSSSVLNSTSLPLVSVGKLPVLNVKGTIPMFDYETRVVELELLLKRQRDDNQELLDEIAKINQKHSSDILVLKKCFDDEKHRHLASADMTVDDIGECVSDITDSLTLFMNSGVARSVGWGDVDIIPKPSGCRSLDKIIRHLRDLTGISTEVCMRCFSELTDCKNEVNEITALLESQKNSMAKNKTLEREIEKLRAIDNRRVVDLEAEYSSQLQRQREKFECQIKILEKENNEFKQKLISQRVRSASFMLSRTLSFSPTSNEQFETVGHMPQPCAETHGNDDSANDVKVLREEIHLLNTNLSKANDTIASLHVELKSVKENYIKKSHEAATFEQLYHCATTPENYLRIYKAFTYLRKAIRASMCRRRLRSLFPATKGSKLYRQVRKRGRICQEIVESEQAYVNSLVTLYNSFYLPIKSSSLLTGAELSRIFGNLNELIDIHKTFLHDLKACLKAWPLILLGDLFRLFARSLPIYSTYVSVFVNSKQVFDKLILAKRDLKKLYDSIIQSAALHGSLEFYSIMPLQRLPRYSMLLGSLKDQTEIGHIDYRSLSSALSDIQSVCRWINSVMERRKIVHNLEFRLTHCSLKLDDGKRWLVKEGIVWTNKTLSTVSANFNTIFQASSISVVMLKIFLLSDMIVLTTPEPASDNCRFEGTIMLDRYKCRRLDPSNPEDKPMIERLVITNGIVFHSLSNENDVRYILIDSQVEREEWMEAIEHDRISNFLLKSIGKWSKGIMRLATQRNVMHG